MNRALLRISLACLAMFVLLLLNVNYVQAFEANNAGWQARQHPGLQPAVLLPARRDHGRGDGTDVKIAESRLVKGSDIYQRYYPFGKVYAPVTGYDTIYSQSGIEQAENSLLAGTDPRLAVHNFTALLTGKQKQGADGRADDQPGGADCRVQGAQPTTAATRPRWWRSSRAPGPSWRWPPIRRSTRMC